MEKIKLKKIKETTTRVLYKIDQDRYRIGGVDFKVRRSTANLSAYLNKNNSNLVDLLTYSVDNNKCYNCSESVSTNRFSRNTFVKYKFCKNCDTSEIKRGFRLTKCIICEVEILYKDIIFSTCGNDECIKEHRNDINESIKETHWINKENSHEITKARVRTRKKNDIKYNRVYTPWNKGKTGIYSKETIEKIRNATIKQMREGRIKKTEQEKKFERYLIQNNINYKYSFIYKRRQFDFLLIDYNTVVELHGDYWHANPKYWDVYGNDDTKKKLYKTQKMKIKDDIIKENMIRESQYSFIQFWEDDILNNFDKIDEEIKKIINNYDKKI